MNVHVLWHVTNRKWNTTVLKITDGWLRLTELLTLTSKYAHTKKYQVTSTSTELHVVKVICVPRLIEVRTEATWLKMETALQLSCKRYPSLLFEALHMELEKPKNDLDQSLPRILSQGYPDHLQQELLFSVPNKSMCELNWNIRESNVSSSPSPVVS